MIPSPLNSHMPPPPPARAEEQIRISRDGSVLGVWPRSAIRALIVAGDLRPTDFYWAEGDADWHRFVPDPSIPATAYPYIGDDVPIYFIRDGLLFGPRTAGEIDALADSGWLAADALVTVLGAEQWWTLTELRGDAGEIPWSDLAAAGVRAYTLGDLQGMAGTGMHAVRKAFAWIAKSPPLPQ